jgi:hypothetical protein
MFADLTDVEKLDRALEVLALVLDTNDKAQDITVELWGLVLREGWWRAWYGSV